MTWIKEKHIANDRITVITTYTESESKNKDSQPFVLFLSDSIKNNEIISYQAHFGVFAGDSFPVAPIRVFREDANNDMKIFTEIYLTYDDCSKRIKEARLLSE